MRIFIPTMGRPVERQYTLRELPKQVRERYKPVLVAPPADAKTLRGAGFEVWECRAKGIAATRQWILDNSEDPLVLMLDDDLSSWSWRVEPGPKERGVKYYKAIEEERVKGFREVERLLHKYRHGSIGHRLFANNRAAEDFNTRQLRALAYDRDHLKAVGVKFRLPVMEDFDVQLQLLKKGYPCFQYNQLVQEQNGSNVDGGCSTYRTHKVQADAAKKLAQLHPDCVTVVERDLKVGWAGEMGGTRTDVRINWRRAVQAGYDYMAANTTGEPRARR
jgi:hypothetical protein